MQVRKRSARANKRNFRYTGEDKIMINSKKKGAKGERELANKLKEYGYNCRRGQQYNRFRGRRCSRFRLYTY